MQSTPLRACGRRFVRTCVALAASLFLVAGAHAQQAASRVQPSAAQQMALLASIKTSKSAVQHRIDSRLYLGLLNARSDQRVRGLPDFRFVRPDDDGLVRVEIVLDGIRGMKPVLTLLEQQRAVVLSKNAVHPRVQARVRLHDLEAIAALQGVRRVRQPLPAMSSAINVSEGDATHGVPAARNVYGVSGAGVKICVLSDGVDSLAALQASDDLPAVEILPGQAGSGDEGSAMLEIVHDLAPDATLAFATATTDEASFAQNILDLAAAGCQVIVDDIIYLGESPFQDGPVAQSVNTVTAAGVLYFSSAGNEGSKDLGTSGTWEGDFNANGTPPVLTGGGDVHDFGDGGQSITVTSGSVATPGLMIWAEHYDLNTGAASTDFDLYALDATLATIYDASTDVQDGTGGDDFPIEFIGGGVFTGDELVVARFAAGATSTVPMFNLIAFRGEIDAALSTGGTTRGHSAAADAYSVAATPAAEPFDPSTPTGPTPGLFTGANAAETFSADGPRRLILSPTGTELTPGNRTSTGGVVRQKPDITAADGVSTASPGFATFYGTSAAAPHAAAIAGLMKQGAPAATPAQIRTALTSSAIDIGTPGVDRTTGAGIIMAVPALQALGAQPVAYLDDGTWTFTERVGDGDAAVEPNEDWWITIPLENVGGVAATAISASLATSTPGVVIVDAASGYPDLAPAATAGNALPFSFYVDPTAVCGASIEFELTVTYAGGSSPTQAFAGGVATGGTGVPQTFSSSDGPIVIPDGADLSGTAPGAPATSTIAATGIGQVHAVSMRIDGESCDANAGSTTVGIDHTFVNDLELTLVSPAGTEVLVINNTDGSGNNFCQTELSDASVGPNIQTVVSASAPFTGSFLPNASFSAYTGEAGDGNWSLRAQDFFSQDTGNLRAWSVTVTPAVCDAPILVPAPTVEKTVAGDFVEGGTVVYTIVVENNGNIVSSGGGLLVNGPGNELLDVLPAGLTAASVSASAGVATLAGNTAAWSGSLLPGGSVTITIEATIDAGTAGQSLSNSAILPVVYNHGSGVQYWAYSDDPGVPGESNPTAFTVLQGELSITPAAIDFGDLLPGSSSVAEMVVLANTGEATLQVTSFPAPPAPFSRQAFGSCPDTVPFALAAGADCVVYYLFQPTTAGDFTEVLVIEDDAGGSTAVTLTGTGAIGQLAVAPAALDFGDVDVDTTSAAQAFTVSNPGTGDLIVAGISAPASGFVRNGGTCGASSFTLAPGANCTVQVVFAPTAPGAASGSFTVNASDAAIASQGVAVSGNATLLSASLSDDAMDLGDVPVGDDGFAYEQGIAIVNDGTEPVEVTSFGTVDAPFYYAGTTCPALPFTLAPGALCIVGYGIAPTAPGSFSQTVTFSTSAGDLSFELSGQGSSALPPPVPQPAVIPALSTLGLLLTMLLVGLAGFVGLRRQH